MIGARLRLQVLGELDRPVVDFLVNAGSRPGWRPPSTLRFTSPQAAMESMSAAFMPCIVVLRSFLITPCSWKAWRVVRRSVPRAVGARELRSAPATASGVHDAAGQARADHEAVGRLELLMLALGAQVAIVLHVAAVELDELRVGLADRAGQRIVRGSRPACRAGRATPS